MTKNIYNLFREYNKLPTKSEKTKYLAKLNYNLRETFKNLLEHINDSQRFDNIYDGWIENIDDEIVVLEIYSVILKTNNELDKFCIDAGSYNNFIKNKREMLQLLLANKQYSYASKLLEIHMFSDQFREEKLTELKENVMAYLIEKKVPLPKKIIKEIYKWAEAHKLPSYLIEDLQSDFQFQIRHNYLPLDTLKEDVEEQLKTMKLEKIVDNLLSNPRVSS